MPFSSAKQRSHRQYERVSTVDEDAEQEEPEEDEGEEAAGREGEDDPWFHGALDEQSDGDPRGGRGARDMSAVASFQRWDQRDIAAWRDELAKAADEDETRVEKTFTLLIAASSYVAAGGWSAWVKKYACPATSALKGGALCQNMCLTLWDCWELYWFVLWCFCMTVFVAIIVWLMHVLREAVQETVAKRADDGGALTAEEEKLVATKALKAVDLISGGWIYNSALLWSIALHSFLSYTKLSGAWWYFCLNFTFVFLFSMASWELAPVLTAWMRKHAPALASKPTVAVEETRPAKIAKAFGGSMAWLLAIALIQALEVTIAVFWPTGNEEGTSDDGKYGATLVYYAGGLHNLPLFSRWVLFVLVVCATLPLLIFEKRSTERPIRDALVGALMERGEWDAAALLMRANERMRGLLVPMLAYTGTQALFRAIEKSFTPHSWSIFFFPATPQELMGQGSANIENATAATEAATAGGVQAAEEIGLSRDIAGNVTQTLVKNATDTNSASDNTVIADSAGDTADLVAHDAGVLRIQDAAAQGVADYICEKESECWAGTCCPYQVLWGVDIFLYVYAVGWTFVSAWFLTSRDRIMRNKLEHAIALTQAGDPRAVSAQRNFVIEWELSAMLGGVMAYIVGKVWNDTIAGEGAPLHDFKGESPLQYACVMTVICVLVTVAEARGHCETYARKLTLAL